MPVFGASPDTALAEAAAVSTLPAGLGRSRDHRPDEAWLDRRDRSCVQQRLVRFPTKGCSSLRR